VFRCENGWELRESVQPRRGIIGSVLVPFNALYSSPKISCIVLDEAAESSTGNSHTRNCWMNRCVQRASLLEMNTHKNPKISATRRGAVSSRWRFAEAGCKRRRERIDPSAPCPFLSGPQRELRTKERHRWRLCGFASGLPARNASPRCPLVNHPLNLTHKCGANPRSERRFL